MACPYFRAQALASHVVAPPAGGPLPADAQLTRCPAAALSTPFPADYAAELRACRDELYALLDETNCNPILVRLAWHDSGTCDASVAAWPACGGANGSLRFSAELAHGANAGLTKGVTVYLAPIHKRHPAVSWADLMQLASACAVKHAGGPTIPMRFGRVDVPSADCCPAAGRLPEAAAPFPGAPDAATHLRHVFYRMGFNDQEIVALSGAHTLGRAFAERSGQSKFGYGNAKGTQWTVDSALARADGKPGVGMPGGQSWTRKWLTFSNDIFQPSDDPALLRLATDSCLATDAGFRPHFLRYGADCAAFFADYARAHAKLSELGAAFRPAEGVRIEI